MPSQQSLLYNQATGSLPSAPSNLLLVNQGGSGNTSSSTQQFTWNPAVPGAYPIAKYNIYRAPVSASGVGSYSLIGSTSSGSVTSYSDTTATNSNVNSLGTPASPYIYRVAAVDSVGNVGPQQTQVNVYGYQACVSNWSQKDYSYGLTSLNYSDTSGSPPDGTYDIEIVYPANGAGFQPYSYAPQAYTYDLEIGAFNYFNFKAKCASNSQPIFVSHLSRLVPGDVYPYAQATNIFSGAYGTFVANQWCNYKIPLSVVTMGISNVTGSISSGTLNITSVQSGFGVDCGGFIIGPGIPAGTCVTSYNQSGSIGTFGINNYVNSISGLTIPAGTAMVFQRTNMYKVDFGMTEQSNSVTLYVTDFGWSVN